MEKCGGVNNEVCKNKAQFLNRNQWIIVESCKWRIVNILLIHVKVGNRANSFCFW